MPWPRLPLLVYGQGTATPRRCGLHPYLYDEMRHDPRDAALRDENEFEVEAILNHSGTPKKRVDMKFLVKWKGYEEPSSNTWEPWANVRRRSHHRCSSLHRNWSRSPHRTHRRARRCLQSVGSYSTIWDSFR